MQTWLEETAQYGTNNYVSAEFTVNTWIQSIIC